MNKFIKTIEEEATLFFDCEVVRRSKELDINSKEFELFQRKIRDKQTDRYLPDEEVLEEYKKRGALKMCYSTIVSIGVGFINKGKVYIKAIDGEEEDIIKEFCKIASQFKYLAGSNIIKFDLPLVVNNGYRYFDVSDHLPDQFITSDKKPWQLENICDLQNLFTGTHYSASSLDEMCYHFGLPSSKTDIDGAKVSEEFWENGVEKINNYVKGDVFSCVNLFKKMRFEDTFETYIDKNTGEEVFFGQDLTIFQRLMKTGVLSEAIKNEFKSILSESDDNELEKASKLIKAHYLIPKGAKKENKRREDEVDELIQEISNANYERRSDVNRLKELAETGELTDGIKSWITKKISNHSPSKEELEDLYLIIRGAYVQTDFENKREDSKKRILEKEKEIKTLLNIK